jgi:hypothetical protein
MGIINTSRDGMSTSTLADAILNPDQSIEEIQNEPIVDTTYDNIEDLATIKDISTIRSSLNTDRDVNTIRSIIASLSGSKIECSYYQKYDQSVLSQTSYNYISTNESAIKTPMLCIHNFIFKLINSFEYSYDTEGNISSVTGTGITYPKFEPNKGDVFLYPLENNQLGLFVISDTERLSPFQNTVFKINFYLRGFLDQASLDEVKKACIKEVYFNENGFLSGDDSLYLDTEEYVDFETAKELVSAMIQYYYKLFYDNRYKTIFRNDNIYDIFVIEFLNKITDFSETFTLPRSFLIKDFMEYTIFDVIHSDYDIELNDINPFLYLKKHTFSNSDININNLINRTYITTNRDNTCYASELYIFSKEFYEYLGKPIGIDPFCTDEDQSNCIGYGPILEDPSTYTGFTTMENILIKKINKTLTIDEIISYALQYKTFSDKDKFYHIPILIYLLKEYMYRLIK